MRSEPYLPWMDFQLNLFSWPEPPHVIALAKGTLNADSMRQIFGEVAKMAEPLPNGKVLVDLARAKYLVSLGDIDSLIKDVGSDSRLANATIAIVSPSDIEQYHDLLKLSNLLSAGGVHAGTFRSIKLAVDWLAISS
jgi:hypothetical protein